MSLIPVDAVKIVCDGCQKVFDDDGDLYLREEMGDWLNDRGWETTNEGNNHYCPDCRRLVVCLNCGEELVEGKCVDKDCSYER